MIDSTAITKQNHSSSAMLYALSRLFERAGYYGFRSILVLYLMSSTFGMTDMEAIGLYGTFASLFYLAKMLGGLLGDLVIGNKLALVIGGGLQIIGVLILSLPNTIGLYTGITFLIIGSGLYDPNLLAVFGKQYLNKPKVIDSGFGLFYIGINIGAFIGVFFVLMLSDIEMYYGFLLAAGFYVLATGTILIVTDDSPIESEEVTTIKEQPYQIKPINVFLVILAMVLSGVFWMFYELTASVVVYIGFNFNDIIFEITGGSMYSAITDVNFGVILILGSVLCLLWFYMYSSSVIKIAIGFLLAAVSYAILIIVPSINELTGLYLFITSAIVLGVAELFVVPPILSILTLRSNPKYLAIIMGTFSLAISLFMVISTKMSSIIDYLDASNEQFILLISIIILTVFGLGLAVLHFILKYNSSETIDTENDNYLTDIE